MISHVIYFITVRLRGQTVQLLESGNSELFSSQVETFDSKVDGTGSKGNQTRFSDTNFMEDRQFFDLTTVEVHWLEEFRALSNQQ